MNREAHPLAGSTLRLNLSAVLSVVENCFPQLLYIPVIALSSMWPPGEDATSRPGTTPVEIRIPPDVPSANGSFASQSSAVYRFVHSYSLTRMSSPAGT